MTISPLQLHKDYVTKNEFNLFKGDMRNFLLEFGDFKTEMYVFKDDMQEFRSETKARLVGIDNRFDGINKRLDVLSSGFVEYKENSFNQMGIIKDSIKDDLRIIFDHIKTLESKIDQRLLV